MTVRFVYGVAIFSVSTCEEILMLVNVGFSNFIASEKVVAVLEADSSPVRRLSRIAKETNSLLDATCGRKTQSVIITDSGYVVLSALDSETVSSKIRET